MRSRNAKTRARRKGWSGPCVRAFPFRQPSRRDRQVRNRRSRPGRHVLRSLGQAGVPLVCYNFMPVVDWTRTELEYALPHGGLALRFDMVDFVAYDVHILRRPGAEADYESDLVEKAARRHAGMSPEAALALEHNIISGLPGGEGHYTRETLRDEIAKYDGIDAEAMRRNLTAFLSEVAPVAEANGVTLVIHPDDPPFLTFRPPSRRVEGRGFAYLFRRSARSCQWHHPLHGLLRRRPA